jgi:hypothetical protein
MQLVSFSAQTIFSRILSQQNISSIIGDEWAEVNPPKRGVFAAERMVVLGELVTRCISDCLPCLLHCTSPVVLAVCTHTPAR